MTMHWRMILGISLTGSLAVAQDAAAQSWTERDPVAARDLQVFGQATPAQYRVFDLDAEAMASRLGALSAGRVTDQVVMLPTAAGGLAEFRVSASGVMSPQLAAKFPQIQAFQGSQVDRPEVRVRMELTPLGFGAMVFGEGRVELVQPVAIGEAQRHIVFDRASIQRSTRSSCGFNEQLARSTSLGRVNHLHVAPAPHTVTGETFRVYSVAVAATGEYTAFFGGSVAGGLSGVVSAMNRVNEVYQTDLGVQMVLVANNNLVIYTDAGTDPYTNDDAFEMLDQNQATLDSVIGDSNYDVGHVFSTGGGGVAGLGVPCEAGAKAQGVTGRSAPVGDPFYIDYVAHEMGHQFGAPHSFNGTTGACGGGNRDGLDAYEPGSGSTIMGYAGICGGEDLQPNSDPYFHAGSLQRMQAYVSGAGASCAVNLSGGGAAPTIDAGIAANIPASTPFTLQGSGPSGAGYRYTFEQFNLGTAAPPNIDNGTRAIFRSFNPIAQPQRTVPLLSTVLDPPALPLGEAYATSNRALLFRLTAREQRTLSGSINAGVTVSDDVTYTVSAAAGPFVVTAPAAGATVSNPFAATWNVAGTTAAPISCANVEIALSTDNGLTFPSILAASTPNDGTQSISTGSPPTATARVRVRCVSQPFFNINPGAFSISASNVLFGNGFE